MQARKIIPVFTIGSLALSAGCAKSPAGGPTNPLAPNRMTVTMRVQQPVTRNYLYSFAFDDNNNASDGPVAIIGPTTIANGVVAGSFTVLVQYEAGQYVAYRRTAGPNGTETLDRASAAFVTQPTPVTRDTFAFTLDLDAVTDSGAPLFTLSGSPQRLDVNFITANERRRDPNDNTRKAFDAFGPRAAGAYGTFTVGPLGTFRYTNADNVQEPTNDVQTDDTSGLIDLEQLDITDFSIVVERT
jgi:hypothetical protein